MLPLIERGPKWTVQIGTFKKNADLADAIKTRGFRISDEARDLIGKIELAQEPTAIEVFQITPGDVGFTSWVRRDRFYEAVAKLGFVPIPAEVGPQALLQFGDELAMDEWIAMGVEPITDSNGDLGLLNVERNEDGVYLYYDYGYPDGEWNPDDQFLSRRK